ncbi:MAG: helix-turn-helix transcriptional regulator [Ignavibacteriales bacterium]|nr:helix-turn-helix transcriptional regulator [Ignavibacteriales bacterium]
MLNWFRVIVYAFIAMWFIDFCSLLGNIFFQIPAAINIVMTFVSISINAVFANLTIFNGLQYPHLFLHKEEEPKQTTAESSLPPFNVEALKKKLTDAMQLHKLYLDPGITLGLLSVKSGINTKYLSQLINEHMGMNFYEFINSYRIKEAEKMLLSEEHAEKTILEILYTCGFNSKSVFNNVFKKATGITPTAYRRKKNFIYG